MPDVLLVPAFSALAPVFFMIVGHRRAAVIISLTQAVIYFVICLVDLVFLDVHGAVVCLVASVVNDILTVITASHDDDDDDSGHPRRIRGRSGERAPQRASSPA
jgi:hypothetical protein